MLFWLLLSLLGGLVGSSSAMYVRGDQYSLYQSCGKRCATTGCYNIMTPVNSTGCAMAQACIEFTNKRAPWHLALTQWSCQDDCRYECMREMEEWRASHGRIHPAKYYGKWAFQRVAGFQELLSSIFSLVNFLAQLHNIIIFTRLQNKSGGHHLQNPSYKYTYLWQIYAICHANAWLWSTVFHMRDTPVTEKFDYLSADINVFVGVYITVQRCWNLSYHAGLLAFTTLSGGFMWLAHYMLFIKFDYGFNVKVCIALGATQGLVWAFWAWRKNHPGRRTLWVFFICLYTSLLAEIFDFPPVWKLLDAHALWHACTVPLTYLWYHFIYSDVVWVTQQHSKNA